MWWRTVARIVREIAGALRDEIEDANENGETPVLSQIMEWCEDRRANIGKRLNRADSGTRRGRRRIRRLERARKRNAKAIDLIHRMMLRRGG